jgi:hypothetical protein
MNLVLVSTKSTKMHTKLHHHFFLKKNKKKPHECFTIYLRITVDGKRSELSTGRSIERNSWMPRTARVKSSSKKAKRLNNELNRIEYNLLDAYHLMIRQSDPITAVSLKNKYLGVEDESRMLVSIFQKHNQRMAKLVPKEFAAGTLERYKTSLSHTIEFIGWKYSASDINILRIDHDFISEFCTSSKKVDHHYSYSFNDLSC